MEGSLSDPRGATEHYVSRDDGRVYYSKVGRGEPVVLLHSVGLSGWTWRKVLPSLADRLTCYNVDMPGFDHSDIPGSKYSIHDFTQAIIDVLDCIGLKRTSIIGDHTGAMVAVDLAVTHPERVNKMVLDGLPYWNEQEGLTFFEKYFLPQLTDVASYNIPVAPMLTWEEAEARSSFNVDREIWQKREEIKGKSRLWIRLCQETNTRYDTAAAGPRIKAPTLLLYGEGDMSLFGGERAWQGIKGSTLRVFQGARLGAHQHDPDEFARQALEFLLERP